MGNIINELMLEKKKIEYIVEKSKSELRKLGETEEGIIKVLVKRGKPEFYVKNDSNTNDYKYMPKSETQKAEALVRKEYYEKVLKNACVELKQINALINRIEGNNWEKAYETIGKGKRMIVEPIIVTNEQYRKKWLDEEYTGKSFGDNDIEIYSENGDRVRSKSEKIIADKLFKENVLYRYEYPFQTNYSGIIYPDFTILDEVRRRNIIYEHFGLMDNPEYANNAVGKIQLYMNHGYVLGDNLFISMETSAIPFDGRVLDGIIKQIKN